MTMFSKRPFIGLFLFQVFDDDIRAIGLVFY